MRAIRLIPALLVALFLALLPPRVLDAAGGVISSISSPSSPFGLTGDGHDLWVGSYGAARSTGSIPPTARSVTPSPRRMTRRTTSRTTVIHPLPDGTPAGTVLYEATLEIRANVVDVTNFNFRVE